MKTNKFLRVTALALALTLALCTAASAATLGVVRMPTKDGSVFLRSGGGTSYPTIGYANHGDMLQITYEGRSWDKVTMRSGASAGRSGWMYNKYITNLRDITDISGWGALAHIKTNYADSTVCLRKGPGTSYGIKEYLRRDDMLIILDKYSSKWYEVQVIGSLRTGYVSKTYIANGAAGKTTANVNQRKTASTNGKVLQVIPAGESITVLSIGKSWSKVRYDGVTGYVWNSYIRLN